MKKFEELKVKMTLSIGMHNASQKDEFYLGEWIDEESYNSMSEAEREKCIGEMVEDWANNYIDIGWSVK